MGLMVFSTALAINILSRPGHGIWGFQIKISYAQFRRDDIFIATRKINHLSPMGTILKRIVKC